MPHSDDAAGEGRPGMSPPERRTPVARRGPDRRRPGSRVNREAPDRSLLLPIGNVGVATMAAVLVVTGLGASLLALQIPPAALLVQGGLLGASLLLLALGGLEQRLIEIRLELMMLNGGRRQGEDRRRGDRRGRAAA